MSWIEYDDSFIVELVPELEMFEKEERCEKMKLLYRYGFIYMPYDERFVNPFENIIFELKVLKLSKIEIEVLLKQSFVISDKDESIIKKIDERYKKFDSNSKLKSFLNVNSLLVGMLIYFVGIILMIFVKAEPLMSIIIQIIGFYLTYYWIQYHTLFSRKEDATQGPIFFIEYRRILQFLIILAAVMTVFFIYHLFDSYVMWIVQVFFISSSLFTNYFITKHISQYWWAYRGLPCFKEFYNDGSIKKKLEDI